MSDQVGNQNVGFLMTRLICFSSDAQGQLLRSLVRSSRRLNSAKSIVIVTCKYEKDPIKNSRENAETLFFPIIYLYFLSDAQGQLLRSLRSDQAESLLASMKKIRSKTAKKTLKHCITHYNHHDHIGAICCHV